MFTTVFFELKIWFVSTLVSITNSGDQISLFHSGENKEFSFYLPLKPLPSMFDGQSAIEGAMSHIAIAAKKILEDPLLDDNFESSYIINKQSLKIIETICHN